MHCESTRISGLLVAVVAVVLMAAPRLTAQQVSLAMEDRIDNVPVQVGPAKETFTVIRDAWTRTQWYVVPNKPRLAEQVLADGTRVPVLSVFLLNTDGKNGAICDEALLQFAVTLAVPPEAQDALKAHIAQKENVEPKEISLTGLPLSAAEAHLYLPATGEFLASASLGAGIGPVFNTQQQTFTVHLTKKGADLMAAALRSGTGLNVSYVLKYEGLTPKAGFKILVNWNQVFTHYSREDRVKARASFFGLVSANFEYQRQKLFEDLLKDKSIQIEVIEGSGFKAADAQKYIDPILARINAELLEDMKPPEKVDPARASEPNAGGFFGGVGYSIAIKDVRKTKTGTETITFAQRSHVERTTVAAGFVNLKGFNEKAIADAIVVVPPGPWKSSYFMLPVVGTDIGIQQAHITLQLVNGTETVSTRTATWSAEGGKGVWATKDGPTSLLSFPLLGLGVKDPSKAKFKMRVTLTTRESEIVLDRELPAVDGSLPLPSLNQRLFDVVQISPSALAFRQLDKESDKQKRSPLEAVHVTLKAADESLSTVIEPFNDNGNYAAPRPVFWFVPKPENGAAASPITLDVRFQVNGTNIPFAGNGDLRQNNPSLRLSLSDRHWKPEEANK